MKKVEPEPSSSEESDDDEDEEEEEEVQVPRRIGKRMSIKELRRVMTLKKVSFVCCALTLGYFVF